MPVAIVLRLDAATAGFIDAMAESLPDHHLLMTGTGAIRRTSRWRLSATPWTPPTLMRRLRRPPAGGKPCR